MVARQGRKLRVCIDKRPQESGALLHFFIITMIQEAGAEVPRQAPVQGSTRILEDMRVQENGPAFIAPGLARLWR